MSAYVLDASFALMWCFADRATKNTDYALQRMESHEDDAYVPAVSRLEVGNVLGQAVARQKVDLPRALEAWEALGRLPIQEQQNADVAELISLAVTNNLSLYDSCFLHLPIDRGLPLAANDRALQLAARANGLEAISP